MAFEESFKKHVKRIQKNKADKHNKSFGSGDYERIKKNNKKLNPIPKKG